MATSAIANRIRRKVPSRSSTSPSSTRIVDCSANGRFANGLNRSAIANSGRCSSSSAPTAEFTRSTDIRQAFSRPRFLRSESAYPPAIKGIIRTATLDVAHLHLHQRVVDSFSYLAVNGGSTTFVESIDGHTCIWNEEPTTNAPCITDVQIAKSTRNLPTLPMSGEAGSGGRL